MSISEKKVIRLYKNGLSICQIADRYGLHRSAVNNIVRKSGNSRPGRKLGKDISGQRFGKLVAICVSHVYVRPSGKSAERVWLCQCDCGGKKAIRLTSLREGFTKSCGCMGRGRKFDASLKSELASDDALQQSAAGA